MRTKSIGVVLFLIPAISTAADQAELEANKQVIRRFYEAIDHYPAKLGEMNELVSEDFVDYGKPGQPRRGREPFVELQLIYTHCVSRLASADHEHGCRG